MARYQGEGGSVSGRNEPDVIEKLEIREAETRNEQEKTDIGLQTLPMSDAADRVVTWNTAESERGLPEEDSIGSRRGDQE